ncbi:MAG: protein-L-isoaspartate(D-aspartate) O-methyltransferase [bacterium]
MIRFRNRCFCGLVIGLVLLVAVTTLEARSSYKKKRHNLVEQHIRNARTKTGVINDTSVLNAMMTVPRHRFVPADLRSKAYENRPLPIGYGQTISQPYIVAYMTQLLEVGEGDTVLEVGTGSGYQAAVLAQIVDRVFTIEIIPELHQKAQKRLNKLGYDNVTTRHGDGYYGWSKQAPFDGIIVTAAASHNPPPLIEQLKPGGNMIIPVGPPFRLQRLMLLEKGKQGDVQQRSLATVRFVPFRRTADQ